MNEICVEILLVEDNSNDAGLILRKLEAHHLSDHVVWLKDGKEALDFIFAEGQYLGLRLSAQPKVIILDLSIPEVSGLEVLRKIREHPTTKGIPVVILASSKEEKALNESYKHGVRNHFVKPVDPDGFIKGVQAMLSLDISAIEQVY